MLASLLSDGAQASLMVSLRNRIVQFAMIERMAAPDALDRHHPATPQSVLRDGLITVLRARWCEPAARWQHLRDRHLIEADQPHTDVFHGACAVPSRNAFGMCSECVRNRPRALTGAVALAPATPPTQRRGWHSLPSQLLDALSLSYPPQAASSTAAAGWPRAAAA